ncbi:MAG: NlpC/P60 family protein [Terracidiphilus sp.]
MNSNKVLAQGCFLLILSALSCMAAAGQLSVAKPDYVVSKPVVNMYHSASADSEVVSQALYGSGVAALERKDSWIHIRTGDDYTGWVTAEDVTAQQVEYAPAGKAVSVGQLSANIYREPDVTKHAPVLNLPWEARLEVLSNTVDKGGRWIQIKLVNGQTAYVEQGNVSASDPALTIDQTIQLAHRFLGITYTWGGVSTYGYDCSGFMQMLVRQRGILMPRDADVQANWSGVMPVERKALQPGDLLYFGGSLARITHTGMYIGNGEFIHDTTNTHPGVQISKLDDMPWTKLLVAARRVK